MLWCLSTISGSVFRQRAIRYLSVLPAEWIQALPRYSNCPPKPDTLQEAAGDQAPTHHRTGKKKKRTYQFPSRTCIIPITHLTFISTGSGIFEWRSWGEVEEPRGCAFWHTTAPQCWLWLRVPSCPSVEEGQAATHPASGAGEGNTGRCLACKLDGLVWSIFSDNPFVFLPLWHSIFLYSPQAMEGSMLTISLGIWMELPGVNYRDLTNGKRRYWERTVKTGLKSWLHSLLLHSSSFLCSP